MSAVQGLFKFGIVYELWYQSYFVTSPVFTCFSLCLSLSLSLYLYLSTQQQEQDPTNLYISNLPLSMDEQDLEAMLKPFGQVVSTRILRDANGASRGVGFAR